MAREARQKLLSEPARVRRNASPGTHLVEGGRRGKMVRGSV